MAREMDIAERRSKLSPAKQALLEKRLQGVLTPDAKAQVISRRPELDVVPLSFAQERLWFLDQFEPGNPAYNRPVALRLTGPLNVMALEQALSEILRRHEVLRATFSTIEGRAVQVITSAKPLNLPVMDLRELTSAEREREAMRLATEEAQRPLDLAQGPLLRATLLRLDREDHVLILVIHHIAFDGWSARVLVEELAALYDAFVAGRPSPLPELLIQYADFAHWQRQWLQGEVLEKQLPYWKEKLAGSPPSLNLPTDRPRPAIQTYRGACQSLTLSSSLLQSLQALSRQEGITLFMTLLAAFKVLLHRYTGQEEIVVGSPIAGRTHVETEALIGFFVNTVVLRTDLSENRKFWELLGQVREVALGAYAYQDLPFEKLVEALNPERDLSRPPLFQVMFNLENIPKKALDIQGLNIDEFELDSGIAQFDLTLEMVEKAEGLSCLFEYNADLFDATTIARMLGHYQTLLEGIVADPGQPIGALPLLTEAERHQLLVEWNDTQADYPRDMCIHQLFEAQVERTPNAIAVVFEDQQLTYCELNARANQLAHYLRKHGVKPEVLVGICTERSSEMVTGLLGILKAGGAYVPLDPTYPKERLAFMLEDAKVLLLLTQECLLENLPKYEAKVICLDSDWDIIAEESQKNPASGTTSENAAYVIYTSGSTGRPKGVPGLHRGAVNRFNWMWQTCPFEAGEVCCQKTSLSFVDSVWEIFGPLLQGVRVVIIPDEIVKAPPRLIRTLADNEVTRIVLVPSLLRVMLDCGNLQSQLPQLRIWVTSGEALSKELCQRFFEARPQSSLLNLYGSSEVSADVTWYDTSLMSEENSSVPIGRPVSNIQIYILDHYLNPVPIGVPGELYVGGDGLAHGYLNRPELTLEKFIPNPSSHEPDARLYKTGDLVRYLADGNIEFLGRMDHQVKIRGFRVELGEIEEVLRQSPAVQETIVLAREFEFGDKRLVAYVVPGKDSGLTISELGSFLKAKLPEYMVPSAFVILETLPLTPSGKVDRQALPAPNKGRLELEKAYAVPRDALELQLTEIWEKVLDIQPIGVKDNFFDLGGHSLLAVHLFSQIETIFGRRLPLAALFQAPTIEQLADILRQEGWSLPWSSLIAIQPGGSKPPFFCVPPAATTVLALADLARHLGPEQPFYGLQPLGMDGEHPPHTQIEDMAAHYLKEIHALQPEGPYFLGGMCFGGVVAFEMAQQLQAQGQQVALLAILDTLSPPGYRKPGFRKSMGHYVQQFGYYWKHKGLIPALAKKVRKELIPALAKRVKKVSSFQERGVHQHVLDAHLKARMTYVPQVYSHRITFFWSSEKRRAPDSRLGWSNLTSDELEIHKVPGDHLSMSREPHVQVLAEKLRACLGEAQTAS